MRRGKLASLALGCCLVVATSATAQQERYVTENGVTYRETTRTVHQPVTETVWEEREETVYRDQYSTAVHETQQTVLTPVTEYQWEARVHNAWNPFVPATLGYHLVPKTRWEPRQQVVQMPVTRREVVPEKRIVRVPVRKLGMMERTEKTRVAVNTVPSGTRVTVLDSDQVGGVASYQNDPPRYTAQGAATTTR